MNDDLFRPTVTAEPQTPATPPWRVESIAYPAFFGGALAATVLGLVNGRRLNLRWPALAAITVTGVVALVARVVVADRLGADSSGRVLGYLAGVLVWGVILATQKRPYRAYLQRGQEPASLVKAGFGAVLGLGLIEGLIIAAVIF